MPDLKSIISAFGAEAKAKLANPDACGEPSVRAVPDEMTDVLLARRASKGQLVLSNCPLLARRANKQNYTGEEQLQQPY